jgi:hypothetical protein
MITDAMQQLASTAWESYDFSTNRVTDSEGWDTSDPLDVTRVTYLEPENEDADSFRVSFHVRFNEQGYVTEVYALDIASGGYVGTDPIIRIKIGTEGRVWDIDPGHFSRESGYVILVIQTKDNGTQYAITTDPLAAKRRVEESGGTIVDCSTDFEEVINAQYDGFAVLTTELG